MTMLHYAFRDHAIWQEPLRREIPDLDFRDWKAIEDKASVTFALCWKPPPGLLLQYPNLRAVSSMGAGVEHLLGPDQVPAHVPIVRVVDDTMTAEMSEYIVLHVLRQHRQQPLFAERQREGKWDWRFNRATSEVTVGILGLGELGQDAAAKLGPIGFKVRGWSQGRKRIDGVESFAGLAELPAFLSACDFLVCLLPLTAATENILNAKLFAQLPAGAHLVNVARGAHMVEADLVTALDAGQLASATLDVFREEPLPAGHPFWTHPKITVTPHISAVTRPEHVAPQIAENYRRALAGQPLLNLVDRTRGY